MRLYSRLGAETISGDGNTYTTDAEGGVDVPEEFGEFLHNTHISGQQAWETDAERSTRLAAEEAERRKDPATLLAVVEALAAAQRSEPAPAKKAARTKPADPAPAA